MATVIHAYMVNDWNESSGDDSSYEGNSVASNLILYLLSSFWSDCWLWRITSYIYILIPLKISMISETSVNDPRILRSIRRLVCHAHGVSRLASLLVLLLSFIHHGLVFHLTWLLMTLCKWRQNGKTVLTKFISLGRSRTIIKRIQRMKYVKWKVLSFV